MAVFDLTPDPKVLVALTHTPMTPLDALCELVDNALDSFRSSNIRGEEIVSPLVLISLPKLAEVDRGDGVLRVRDNGPGMGIEHAERALRAGFSGNNSYDSLGLFGMGFNISTGKLGRRTRFLTAQKEDAKAIEVIVDLDKIIAAKSYEVPVNEIEKPSGFEHGTLIEVSNWWPEGSANAKFVRRLVQYGMPVLQREIGRRYATILRGDLKSRGFAARINMNETDCVGYEQCVWDDNRYVKHRALDKIPAVLRFNEVAGSQVRCLECTALVESGQSVCSACGSSSLRTIEQRVRGWVGIQRFDDSQNFGIDLIRNGRTIRVAEKAAFFEFTDEFKNTIKDYPIDQQFGRIVGEVHLDHVPVDFLKQDFQRTTGEWADAMRIVRGESSLQPKQPNADFNTSPLYKLYQGYRRVRDFGTRDMYMGYWDESKNAPSRISREIEKEYYQKFLAKEPGFYDDSEWWKLVEQADTKPIEDLIECPECSSQNLASAIQCSVCDHVLIGKDCINSECGARLPANAMDCPECGTSQVLKTKEPWLCKVCGTRNTSGKAECSNCMFPEGTPSFLDESELLISSNKNDELSMAACSVRLADGSNSDPIDVDVYAMKRPIRVWGRDESIPLHVAARSSKINVFIDLTHELFSQFGLSPQQTIADQIAGQIHRSYGRLTGSHPELHTVPIISWEILNRRWRDVLNSSSEKTEEEILSFFGEVKERIRTNMGQYSVDLYDELRELDRKTLVNALLDNGIDPADLSKMKETGSFVEHLSIDALVHLIDRQVELFLDGRVWDWSTEVSSEISKTEAEKITAAFVDKLQNWMHDVLLFYSAQKPSIDEAKRTRQSLKLLRKRLV